MKMDKYKYIERYEKVQKKDEIDAEYGGYKIIDYDKWKRKQRAMQWIIFGALVTYSLVAFVVGLAWGYNSAWDDAILRADGVCDQLIQAAKTIGG